MLKADAWWVHRLQQTNWHSTHPWFLTKIRFLVWPPLKVSETLWNKDFWVLADTNSPQNWTNNNIGFGGKGLGFFLVYFHQLGPLGRVGLVVAMYVFLSVCLSFFLFVPSTIVFLKEWSQKCLDDECRYLLILIHRGEGAQHYIWLFSLKIAYLIIILYS